MQRSLQKKSLLLIFLAVFPLQSLAAIDAGQEKPPGIQGSILINIRYFGGNFTEFKLQDVELIKVNEKKTNLFDWKDWEKNIPYIYGSEDFRNTFIPARRYHYEREEQLTAIMSQYNLREFEDTVKRYIQTKGKLGRDNYFLKGPGKKF